MAVAVAVGVFVAVSVGVFVGVLVAVFVGVLVGVLVDVTVGVAVRVGVGTNDYSIVADSTATPGWRWFKRRLVTVVTTTGSYQAVSLPTDCTYVTFRTVNGGAVV